MVPWRPFLDSAHPPSLNSLPKHQAGRGFSAPRRVKDQGERPRSMSGVNDIRKSFIDFFARNDHTVVASSPLVPRNDPTLMFTNAGMVQFKNVFTGLEKRPYSPRRHRAEMRARRRQAQRPRQCRLHRAPPHLLRDARQFLLRRLFQGARDRARLGPDHQGIRACPRTGCCSPSMSTTTTPSSCAKKITGLPDSKILRIAGADNFWSMGDTGPCGPCAEIFYDHGEHIPGGPPGSADAEGDRFIEIWNLVFMQYEQLADGKRLDLPRPSIDTGMGLERIAAVLQGTHDNYAIDLFATLIRVIGELTGVDPDGPQKSLAPGDRRPSARFRLSDRRRRAALERGPRLRAAPHHAARHAPRRTARRQGAADVQAGAGAHARDGPGLSGADPRRGADHRDAEAGGDALPRRC